MQSRLDKDEDWVVDKHACGSLYNCTEYIRKKTCNI